MQGEALKQMLTCKNLKVEFEYVKGNAELKIKCDDKRAEMQNKSFKMHHSKI